VHEGELELLANEHPHDAALNTESGPKAAPLDGKAATTRSAAEPVDNDLDSVAVVSNN
jgi:hypothetical protein